MRIIIDLQGAQSLGSRHRGIGRYSLSLAESMVRLGRGHEFIIVLNELLPETIEPIRAKFDGLIAQENIRVWAAAGPVAAIDPANRWRRRAAELEREAFLLSLNPDVVYISSLMEGWDDSSVHSIGLIPCRYCTAVTFYDVIPLIQSEVYLGPHRHFEASYREKIEYLRQADLFFAISQSSRSEAIEHLGVRPETVTSIAAAADLSFKPLSMTRSAESDLRHRLKLLKPFIMYSGATDARKNHLRLITAFSTLPADLCRNYQLAIVGRLPSHQLDKFRQHILACGMTEDQVVITGGVTDLELCQLYNLCQLFVFPSWHEGFGLPALEAMACGAAVIGSNTTSIPEVIGRSDALFDPFDENAIKNKIEEVLGDDKFRQSLREHGRLQAKKFSWESSARIVLEKLEEWRTANGFSDDIADAETANLPDSLIARISAITPTTLSNQDWASTARAIAQNHPRTTLPELYIDVSELARRDCRNGKQRVLRAVLSNVLPNQLSGWQVTPVRSIPGLPGYRKAINFTLTFLGMPTADVHEPLIEPRNGDVFVLGLDVDWTTILQDTYLRSLRRLGVRIYFVLYDLIPISIPSAYPLGSNIPDLQSRWLDVMQQHDGVICISRAVADQVKEWMNAFGEARLRPLKVAYFHPGADLSGSKPSTGLPADSESVLDALTNRTTFISVGTIEPRKGHLQALKAFELLWERGLEINLVIVGKKGWDGINWSLERILQMLETHPEKGQRLFWLEAISDEYLERIYKASDCLLVTSTAEGFAIPIIEAAKYGLSVVARKLAVFREIAGSHAHYFQGLEPESLADQIGTWVCLYENGTAISSAGIDWLTWKQSTAILIDALVSENWYYEWRSGDVMRFRTIGPQFSTTVGKREPRHIESTGKAGFLLCGPYISLEAGHYKVTIRGSGTNITDAYVEVTLDDGRSVLSQSTLSTPDLALTGVLASIEIFVPEKCEGLETRVSVGASTRVAVSHVEILSLNSRTATESQSRPATSNVD